MPARRFQDARNWAAERGDIEAYERLSQRSGWRNDKAITQLSAIPNLTFLEALNSLTTAKIFKNTLINFQNETGASRKVEFVTKFGIAAQLLNLVEMQADREPEFIEALAAAREAGK